MSVRNNPADEAERDSHCLVTRRQVLIGGAAAGVVLATGVAAGVEPSVVMDAKQAFRQLVEGNERFAAGKPEHPHEVRSWRDRLKEGQKPFATIIACSDSRVPPELVFDQGFGDLFMIRVAGNILSPGVVGSIEYAADHLGTPLLVVLGHEGCGAVTAALASPEELAGEMGRREGNR